MKFSNLLLQAAPGSAFGGIITFLLTIVVVVVLFIVFRNIVLWYYKLDVIAKSQTDQTQLLRAILRELESIRDNRKVGRDDV